MQLASAALVLAGCGAAVLAYGAPQSELRRTAAYATPPAALRVLQRSGAAASPRQRAPQRAAMTMKMKGKKGKLPINQRGSESQQAKFEAMKAQQDGLGSGQFPVFNIYVQTPKANMWYPCGSLSGDDNSKNLVDQWSGQGLLEGVYKTNLDRGVAVSLFDNERDFVAQIVANYPQLKKSQKDLTYAYKIKFKGLSEEQSKMTVLTKDMTQGPMDKFKSFFSSDDE